MPRRNRRARLGVRGYMLLGSQRHKGRKRRRDWHHGAGSDAWRHDPLAWPDLGTGADPTQAAPQPLRRGRPNRGPALT